MQYQSKSYWFVSIAVGLCFFLALLSGFFLLPERLAQHFLHRLSLQSGVSIIPVQAHFSIVRGKLILRDTDLRMANGGAAQCG